MLLSLLIMIISLAGCDEVLISQKQKTIELGSNPSMSELVVLKDEVACQIKGNIDTDTLGDIKIDFDATKSGKTKSYSFNYKVVDTTYPTIHSKKEVVITQNEAIVIEDYFYVTDNSSENIQPTLVGGSLDTSTIGSFDGTVQAVDGSGNKVTYAFTYTVQEPYIDLIVGKTYDIILDNDGEVEKIRFTFNGVSIKDTIYPIKPYDYYYSYYKDNAGEKYVVIDLSIENTGGNFWSDSIFDDDYGPNYSFLGDTMRSEVVFGGEYTYSFSSFWIKTAKGDLNSFWGLDPFEKDRIYWITTVADQVKDMSYEIFLPIMGNQFRFSSN